MILEQLLRDITTRAVIGSTDVDITAIEIDSRRIVPGAAFIAIGGTTVDGHTFIPKAIEMGAKAIVCEVLPAEQAPDVTYVQVESTEECVGPLATCFYGYPTRSLKLIGVTGTNGKTTIVTLLYRMFTKLGHRCGLCSTVCNYVGSRAIEASHTTPDPITLNRLLSEMVAEGCEYAFMECSSHAIHQKRIGGLQFAGGIFTNLTRDHLDYHKTFKNYLDAKKAFFDSLPATAFALTNADDKNGLVMTQNTRATVKTYSQQTSADFHARMIEMTFEGMLLEINGREVYVPLVGLFNVSNLLAIYGAATMLGKDTTEVLTVLSELRPVSGRFETTHSPLGYTAIVDYAHTPDALVNVLEAIHEVMRYRSGNIITVCGAGGNRDKGKRPLMAQEAARLSDRVIITSDNPRFEEPEAIIADMLAGLDNDQRTRVLSITDRREAIRTACMLAQKGDVILVAGKGHENYQEVRGVKHHFDDKEELEAIFVTQA